MRNNALDRLVKSALLAALSVILVLAVPTFPVFPAVPFLRFDFADLPILIGTFMFGPANGLMITAVAAALQAALASADGWIGAVMHFCATGAMALTAGSIYKKFHTLKGAVASLVAGALTMTLVMLPMNLLMTPLYMGNIPYKEAQNVVWGLMPYIFAFNALKAFGNSLLTFILYKAVSKLLKKEFIPLRKAGKTRKSRRANRGETLNVSETPKIM